MLIRFNVGIIITGIWFWKKQFDRGHSGIGTEPVIPQALYGAIRDFQVGCCVIFAEILRISKMKNLMLIIMLAAIGTVIPIDASAKVDSATLDRQRVANRTRLEKIQRLRTGKKERRIFKKSESETQDLRSLKLDAIPPSPRRASKNTSNSSEQTIPVNPRRTTTTAQPEHSLEAIPAKHK